MTESTLGHESVAAPRVDLGADRDRRVAGHAALVSVHRLESERAEGIAGEDELPPASVSQAHEELPARDHCGDDDVVVGAILVVGGPVVDFRVAELRPAGPAAIPLATLLDPEEDPVAHEFDEHIGGGDVVGIDAANINAEDLFIQLFDSLSADVTVGTTTPNYVVVVPGGDDTNRAGTQWQPPGNMKFTTGITYAVTTTAGGSTGPDTEIEVGFFYR